MAFECQARRCRTVALPKNDSPGRDSFLRAKL
jgi:hypothetical protein